MRLQRLSCGACDAGFVCRGDLERAVREQVVIVSELCFTLPKPLTRRSRHLGDRGEVAAGRSEPPVAVAARTAHANECLCLGSPARARAATNSSLPRCVTHRWCTGRLAAPSASAGAAHDDRTVRLCAPVAASRDLGEAAVDVGPCGGRDRWKRCANSGYEGTVIDHIRGRRGGRSVSMTSPSRRSSPAAPARRRFAQLDRHRLAGPRGPFAHAGAEHLAGVGACGEQRE